MHTTDTPTTTTHDDETRPRPAVLTPDRPPGGLPPGGLPPDRAPTTGAPTTGDPTDRRPTDELPPVGPVRRGLAAFAILMTLPYLALKVAWLAGSDIGLAEAGFGDSPGMIALNVATAGLDVVALVLAVVLITRRGIRAPAWLTLPPLWIGAGLLGQILVSMPVLLVAGIVDPPEPTTELPPIEGWVFGMVYAGFAGLGIGLLGAFAVYTWTRWGRRTLPPVTGGARAWLATAATAVLGASVVHLLVTDAGLVQRVIDLGIGSVAAGALWALRTDGARRVAVVLAFAGTGALAAWGTYLGVVTIVPNDLVVYDDLPWGTVVASALRALAGIVGGLALVARLRGSGR
ncbi:hypothetical protein ACPYO6_10370 [Georgenia sp. Z1344]|uniref:hypothetical protein n=1 Tax=Georgenia sp. Z1344 TaxID=3416706 RepID=UPI003CF2D0D1